MSALPIALWPTMVQGVVPDLVTIVDPGCRTTIIAQPRELGKGVTRVEEQDPDEVPCAGDRIGDYHIEALIAFGGMGAVYMAQHEDGRRVALKSALANGTCRALLAREAGLLKRVRHSALLRWIDDGDDPQWGPYLVTELLFGESLDEMVSRCEAVSRTFFYSTVTQVCEGLAELHGCGIVHRDLKPDNVFVSWPADGISESVVKLLDLGIAHVATDPIESSGLVGTPLFMAPEQITRGPIGPWTDVYGLGVLMTFIVTGTPPCRELDKCLDWHLSTSPRQPSKSPTAAPWADEQLDRIILRCLAKEPEKRYLTTEALQAALCLWYVSSASRAPIQRSA